MQQQESLERRDASVDRDDESWGAAEAWWQGIPPSAGWAADTFDIGRRMQCMPCMGVAFAIASGPSEGTSMTSTSNLAVQIAAVLACFGAMFDMFARFSEALFSFAGNLVSDGSDRRGRSTHSDNKNRLGKSTFLTPHRMEEAYQWLMGTASATREKCVELTKHAKSTVAVPFSRCATFTMNDLEQRLLAEIRKQELLRAGDRVAVAVSGGADSVALLLLLLELREELGIVVSVAHVNHQLRGADSDADERFVSEFAAAHGLEFHTHRAPVNPAGPAIENTARKLRYDFFRRLARENLATKVATAHTLDDQAETVLLRIFRGTGIRGLAGIHPRLPLEEGASCESRATLRREVIRPLLRTRREELRTYLRERNQSWREDSSNENVAFLRNRVRHRLLPLIEAEFGEVTMEHLAELAEIARAEDAMWSTKEFSGVLTRPRAQGQTLDVRQLLALPLAAERRLLRSWLEANVAGVEISFHLIEKVRDLARGAVGKRLEVPRHAAGSDHPEGTEIGDPQEQRVSICRSREDLELEVSSISTGDYEYPLSLPGKVAVPELGLCIEGLVVDVENVPEEDRKALLDPARVGTHLTVRNWRAGDRFWPAHTKQEKRVKELLADRHLSGAEKKLWPVAGDPDGRVVWIRGFAAPVALQARAGKAIWIREVDDRLSS